MRRFAAAVLLLALLAAGPGPAWAQAARVCGLDQPVAAGHGERLRRFAEEIGLARIEAFVRVSSTVHRTGDLPDCYLTKDEARGEGWRRGRDLWRHAPGAAIGGNRFFNRERRLPAAHDGTYREADLDYEGGRRGARRMVFVLGSDGRWLQWVTLDHYRSFVRVPAPANEP